MSLIMAFRGADGVSAHQFHAKWCRLFFETPVFSVFAHRPQSQAQHSQKTDQVPTYTSTTRNADADTTTKKSRRTQRRS